ncbi:MAG: HIT family protein [Phycisphaerales bacterium]
MALPSRRCPDVERGNTIVERPATAMTTRIHSFVESCRAGTHPGLIGRMASGWVILGDVQVVRGYCLLLPDPVVSHLNVMDATQRQQFLLDMSYVGDAVLAVTHAVRINYEMLGNLEPALHAHVFPRYDDEPSELRTKPVWLYDWSAAPARDEVRDRKLMFAIAAWLREHGRSVAGVDQR